MKIASSSSFSSFDALAAAALLLLLPSVVVVAEVSSVGSCACEAEELGFEIDCTDAPAMIDAHGILKSENCAEDCSSVDCVRSYYVVQAHHDFCPEADIPTEIEDGFHDFDSACVPCEIARTLREDAPMCPPADCDENSSLEGNDAYTALVENGCNLSCGGDVCRDLFLALRVIHDECDHGVLSHAAEDGLHDLERHCADVVCNHPDGGASQLVCERDAENSHDGHDHGHDHSHDGDDESSAGTIKAATGFAAAAAAVVVASVVVIVV